MKEKNIFSPNTLLHSTVTMSIKRDGVNWAYTTGPFNQSYWIDLSSKFCLKCTVDRYAAKFALGTEVRLGNHRKVIPRPFYAPLQLILPGIEPAMSTHKVGEIVKSSPRGIHYDPWVCSFSFGAGTAGCECKTILMLTCTASPTFELTSKARLPYACVTGYDMTPPLILMTSTRHESHGFKTTVISYSVLCASSNQFHASLP